MALSSPLDLLVAQAHSLRPWRWQRIQHSRKALEHLQSSRPCPLTAPGTGGLDGGGSSRAAGAEGIWDLVPAGQGLMHLLEGTGIYTWQSIPNPCGIPTGGDLPSSPHYRSHTPRATGALGIHEAKRGASRRTLQQLSAGGCANGLVPCIYSGGFCSYLRAFHTNPV